MEIHAGAAQPAHIGQRRRSLSDAAHVVRQRSILSGHDLKGWRLSHLMRDAHTYTEVDLAERGYSLWLRDPSHH